MYIQKKKFDNRNKRCLSLLDRLFHCDSITFFSSILCQSLPDGCLIEYNRLNTEENSSIRISRSSNLIRTEEEKKKIFFRFSSPFFSTIISIGERMDGNKIHSVNFDFSHQFSYTGKLNRFISFQSPSIKLCTFLCLDEFVSPTCQIRLV